MSARGILTVCTCGAVCAPMGRCPECEPSELARVGVAAVLVAGPAASPRQIAKNLRALADMARAERRGAS